MSRFGESEALQIRQHEKGVTPTSGHQHYKDPSYFSVKKNFAQRLMRRHKSKLKQSRNSMPKISIGNIFGGLGRLLAAVIPWLFVMLVAAYFLLGPDKVKGWLDSLISKFFGGPGKGLGTPHGGNFEMPETASSADISSGEAKVRADALESAMKENIVFNISIDKIMPQLEGLNNNSLTKVANEFDKRLYGFIQPMLGGIIGDDYLSLSSWFVKCLSASDLQTMRGVFAGTPVSF